MKNFLKTKWFTFGTYLLLVLATLLIGYVLLQNNNTLNKVLTSFFEVAENRTFDYRQSLKIVHNPPIPNKDIIILAIDDPSLEMLWEKYGEWPIPRNVYADIIHYLEKDKPNAIIFDLLFLKSIKDEQKKDLALISAMNGYDNIYTGMNFDRHPVEVRKPVDLPKRLQINLENKSNIDIKNNYGFTNCRSILKELIQGNVNIGAINVNRSSDGIIRKFAPIMEYNGNYYPHLTFKAAGNYISGRNNSIRM